MHTDHNKREHRAKILSSIPRLKLKNLVFDLLTVMKKCRNRFGNQFFGVYTYLRNEEGA